MVLPLVTFTLSLAFSALLGDLLLIPLAFLGTVFLVLFWLSFDEEDLLFLGVVDYFLGVLLFKVLPLLLDEVVFLFLGVEAVLLGVFSLDLLTSVDLFLLVTLLSLDRLLNLDDHGSDTTLLVSFLGYLLTSEADLVLFYYFFSTVLSFYNLVSYY